MNDRHERPDDAMDWDFLEGLWGDAPVSASVPADLRARVHREEWRLRLWAVAEWLVAAGFMAWGIIELATFTDDAGFLRGFLLVWLTCVALGFSLRVRRNLWIPAECSTRAYFDLSEARIRAGWRTLRFAWLLFGFQVLLFLGIEIASRLGLVAFDWRGDLVLLCAFIALFGLGLALWSRWYARNLRARRATLETMRRDLDEADADRSTHKPV